MIKSMTGFGISEYSDGKRNIITEIRAVNHRYCDISVRMPRRYSFAEEKIKSVIKQTVKRGKLDISIIVEDIIEEGLRVRLNKGITEQYKKNLEFLKKEFNLAGEITLELIASLPEVMKSVPDVNDEDEFTTTASESVRCAVEKFDSMRIAEGEKLAGDLRKRGEIIRTLLDKISARAPEIVVSYRERLAEKVDELLNRNIEVPKDRIAMEVAVFADKCNITEELVRLDSHMIQMNSILTECGQPAGKKLDFLVQEMNREANTIGSKANDLITTNLMLEIKSKVEKIREQVQNIE